mgnify:CR=1 FL=1
MRARPLQRILRPRHSRIHAQHGFTLLEVLVAVVVFGIISLLAYGGYNQLIQQSNILYGDRKSVV